MARVESITRAGAHSRAALAGTEEDRLGRWLLRAAVTRWHRARAPPMIVIPVPLEGDSPCHQLDNLLSERTRLTRPGPAFVMVADLATVPLPDARPRRHAEDGVLHLAPGARYVCNHGYPCVQELGSFAKRAGRR